MNALTRTRASLGIPSKQHNIRVPDQPDEYGNARCILGMPIVSQEP